MSGQLLPYQTEGVAFALQRRGTLLADEMGLGKTVQAIGVINADRAIRSVLVVCPKSLVLNWRSELTAWLVRKPSIQIVTYEGTAKHTAAAADLLIVDEAHYVKNESSARTQRLLKLASLAARVLLLTGTPIENRPIELWTLLRMCDPETWDPPGVVKKRIGGALVAEKVPAGGNAGFWNYVTRYCDAKKVQHGRSSVHSHWDFSGATNVRELGERLRASCMLRRFKREVLQQLPDKRRRVIVLPSKGVDDSDLLPGLTFENYNSGVRALRADRVLFEEYSKRRKLQGLAKVDQVVEYVLSSLEGERKVLVFAHHREVIAMLAQALGESCVTVTGETSPADRNVAVARFQSDSTCRVLVGSIGAAGVGLTLTAASHVIFAELDPVPGRMTQAEDRVHRLGQRESVLVDHLVLDRSLDARVCKLLVQKQRVLSAVLDERALTV